MKMYKKQKRYESPKLSQASRMPQTSKLLQTTRLLKNVKDKIVLLLPLIIAGALTITAVMYFNQYTEKEVLKTKIADIEPIFLLANFLILVFSFAINFKSIKNVLSGIKTKTWISLFLIFLFAVSLRVFLAPLTHRLFFDEDIYVEIGKEILVNGKGSLCNYGVGNSCLEYDLMKWPNGYPFLLAVSYFFAGVSEAVAFNVNILLSSMSVIFVALTAYLLTKSEKVSIFAALFFALVPLNIMWSATTATEPIFASLTTFAAFCFFFSFEAGVKGESGDWKSHMLAVSALAYAIQIKSEGLLLLPLFAAVVLILDKKFFKKLEDKKFVILWFLLFVLITPYLVHMKYAFDNDPWGSSGEKLGLDYLKSNIGTNLGFWVQGYKTIEHPLLFTVFALIGSAYMFFKNRRKLAVLATWFFLFLLLYSSFYAGSVLYGVDVRYMLAAYPPFIILSAVGAYAITELPKGGRYKELLSLAIVALTLASFLFYTPSISTPAAKIEEARQARAYHELAMNMTKKLGDVGDNCYIMSHVPSIYIAEGKASLQTWNGQNAKVMDDLFNKTDCIVFDDGYWCNVEPYKSSVCKQMFDGFNLEKIESYTDPTGPTYTFYRVTRKS